MTKKDIKKEEKNGFPIKDFGNDSYYGSSIKDFEDDSGGHSRESGNPEDRSLDPQSSWG